MLLLVFISIAIIYYLIQKQKITRMEKREDFKAKQEEKIQDLLKKARGEDIKNKKITIYKRYCHDKMAVIII